MSARETIRLSIDGRVQGVGYRAFLVREANALALVGWARNRRDGSVEALAAGPRDALDALIAAAWRGPALAQVSNVREDCADAGALDAGATDFIVAPSL